MSESAQIVARRSKANTERNAVQRHGDDTDTREQFVAKMVKAHGAWIAPVIMRWLDAEIEDEDKWRLTDAEVLRGRTPSTPRRVASEEAAA